MKIIIYEVWSTRLSYSTMVFYDIFIVVLNILRQKLKENKIELKSSINVLKCEQVI